MPAPEENRGGLSGCPIYKEQGIMRGMARQCELRLPTGGLSVGWIPAEHAVVGRRFTLDEGEGRRSPPVEVTRAWEHKRTLAEMAERGHDWTRTRRASDI